LAAVPPDTPLNLLQRVLWVTSSNLLLLLLLVVVLITQAEIKTSNGATILSTTVFNWLSIQFSA
jgi:lipopolysaccharide/colanic/teichoic acid biosynthesis glycosyltransferase